MLPGYFATEKMHHRLAFLELVFQTKCVLIFAHVEDHKRAFRGDISAREKISLRHLPLRLRQRVQTSGTPKRHKMP
jgi:hypothetical protein